LVNCMWMAVARGEFERGRRLHHGGVGGKVHVPVTAVNKVNDAVYAGGATDFPADFTAGGTVVAAASGRAGTMRPMKTDRRYDDVSVWV
jgi:hypothetical protein